MESLHATGGMAYASTKTALLGASFDRGDDSLARNTQNERDRHKESRRALTAMPQFNDRRLLWPIVFPLLFAAGTYCWSTGGEFVFDDVPSIRENYSLENPLGFWRTAFGAKHSPISNRPVVALSFALNYAVGGLNPRGYHVVNVVIHCLNAMLLFAVVRRTLVTPNLRGAFDEFRATWTAVAIASLWAAHPLGSEAVAYITQRTTLLMSTFLLLLFYAVLRSAGDPKRAQFWNWTAVAACVLAFLSKEEAVAAPILVVLFERAYLFPSFAEAWRERMRSYAMLASCWVILVAAVGASKAKNPTVGWNSVPQVNAWEWLLTESPVIVRYARLSVWPAPLVASYDWPIVRKLSDPWFMVRISPVPIFLASFLVVGMLVGSIALWRWKPWWGWLGAWFFLLLAPTSSILPIISEIVAERRMYLPMLAFIVPAVIGVMRLVEWFLHGAVPSAHKATVLAAAPILVLSIVAGAFAARHAAVFADEITLWEDVRSKNALTNGSFMSGQILLGYGKILIDQKRHDLAIPIFERAIACESPVIHAFSNLGGAYADVGRWEDAERVYREGMMRHRDDPNLLSNLANALVNRYQRDPPEKQLGAEDPRMKEAYEFARRSLAVNDRNVNAWSVYGSVCMLIDRRQEAEQAWATALLLDPGNVSVRSNQAAVLAHDGRFADAAAMLAAVAAEHPQDATLQFRAAQLYLQAGDKNTAVAYLQRVAALQPDNAEIGAMIQSVQQSNP